MYNQVTPLLKPHPQTRKPLTNSLDNRHHTRNLAQPHRRLLAILLRLLHQPQHLILPNPRHPTRQQHQQNNNVRSRLRAQRNLQHRPAQLQSLPLPLARGNLPTRPLHRALHPPPPALLGPRSRAVLLRRHRRRHLRAEMVGRRLGRQLRRGRADERAGSDPELSCGGEQGAA